MFWETNYTYKASNENVPDVTETRKKHGILIVSRIDRKFHKVDLNAFVKMYVKIEDKS